MIPLSFFDEMVKIALVAKTAPMRALVKAEEHFQAPDKDWRNFEKNLKSSNFRKAVFKADQSDERLKKYVKTFGAYQGSKDEIAKIKSKDSGRTYTIKALPNGRWGCSCKDWQFKHSMDGGVCKHIKSVRQSKLVKLSMVA